MISEIFGLLAAADTVGKGTNRKLGFKVNLNRNRIRSISAFSSNSIFYFPCIVSDQCIPEEVAMTARMLEKSYASFVVACISLMPFHRIRADDQASIEEYLAQFHQNIGMNGGSGAAANKMFRMLETIKESAEDVSNADIEETVGNWLLECWHQSLSQNSDFIKIVGSEVSLNDMFNESALDDKTKAIQARYRAVQDELNTWGFLGEATDDLFDIEDILDSDYDDDDDILDEGVIKISSNKQAVDSIKFSLESISDNKIMSCQSLTKLTALENKLKSLKGKYTRYLNRYKKKWKENKEKGTKSKLAIRFNKLSITDPKAFMKEYGEYIKIINKRLKLVEKRRKELRKRKGLKEDAIPDMLTDVEFEVIDYADAAISESLNASDDQIFMYLDEVDVSGNLSPDEYERIIRSQNDNLNRMQGQIADLQADYTDAELGRRRAELGQRDAERQFINAQKRADSAQRTAHTERKAKQQAWDQAGAAKARTKELESQLKDAQKQFNVSRGKDKALYQAEIDRLKTEIKMTKANAAQPAAPGTPGTDGAAVASGEEDSRFDIDYVNNRPSGGLNMAKATNRAKFTTFSKEIFTDMEMKKANEAIPIFTHANIGFVIDETEEVVTRDVLVGVKAYIHKAPTAELINDIYNGIINKRKFLKFVKFITGEERSLADLLFGFKELRSDALDAKSGAGQWRSAFKRRRRWAKMSIPYLTKEYTPNGTIVMTMNEVEFIRDQYGIDIMRPEHVKMIMDADFLLGFVVLDQANEIAHVTYDGHGYGFQQYTYAMLEREQAASDRMMRELYRAMAR